MTDLFLQSKKDIDELKERLDKLENYINYQKYEDELNHT